MTVQNITAITEDGKTLFTGFWTRDTDDSPIELANEAWDGFIDFDTTAIPDTATITGISLKIYTINLIPAGDVLTIHRMSGKKLADYADTEAGNEALKTDIEAGADIGNHELDADETTTTTIALTAGAITDMMTQLADNYFMIGLTIATQAQFGSEEGANAAYLEVTYTTPVAAVVEKTGSIDWLIKNKKKKEQEIVKKVEVTPEYEYKPRKIILWH